LPEAMSSGPRIIGDRAFATTEVGRESWSGELKNQAKKAATALLVVAVMQAVFALIITVLIPKDSAIRTHLMAVLFGIAGGFVIRPLWARKQPLPAAIVGLLLFVTLHTLDAIADPTQLVRGIIVKIVIIVVLSKAISAGLQYRKLTQQMN